MNNNYITEKKHFLFLDIDGVLNIQSKSYTTSMKRKNLIEPHLVDRLNYLCEKTSKDKLGHNPLDIVISSSWRKHMEELQKQLEKSGFEYWHRVIGHTTTSPNIFHRGEQIWHWLKQKYECPVPGIDFSLFIVDDEMHDIEKYYQSMYLYPVEPTMGLTDAVVQKIIKAMIR